MCMCISRYGTLGHNMFKFDQVGSNPISGLAKAPGSPVRLLSSPFSTSSLFLPSLLPLFLSFSLFSLATPSLLPLFSFSRGKRKKEKARRQARGLGQRPRSQTLFHGEHKRKRKKKKKKKKSNLKNDFILILWSIVLPRHDRITKSSNRDTQPTNYQTTTCTQKHKV